MLRHGTIYYMEGKSFKFVVKLKWLKTAETFKCFGTSLSLIWTYNTCIISTLCVSFTAGFFFSFQKPKDIMTYLTKIATFIYASAKLSFANKKIVYSNQLCRQGSLCVNSNGYHTINMSYIITFFFLNFVVK